MRSVADAFALVQRGDLAGAEAMLGEVMQREPENADAIHLLAGVRHARGDLSGAALLFDRAHQLSPYDAEIAFNRAAVLLALRRFKECVAACADCLRLRPGDPETLLLQGVAQAALGEHEAALANYDAARLDRSDLQAHRAASLIALRRWDEGLAAATRARELNPRNADAHYHRGGALGALNRWPEALEALDAAAALAPKNIAICAARAPALTNVGRFDEALSEIETALARQPGKIEYLMRRAYVLNAANRFTDAIAAYEAVLAAEADNAEAQYALADLLLGAGDFARGLPLYEARWRVGGVPAPPRSEAPRWTGAEPIGGETILVQGEQGFGDLFQFCRFVPALAERGARVILQERPQTLAVLGGLSGVAELAPTTAPPSRADFRVPLASLMAALDVRLETIPAPIPYLHADPDRVARWREMLGAPQRRRIGVVWSGISRHPMQSWRSLDDAALHLLLGADADFVSLQMEESAIAAAHGVRQFGAAIADFADLAALIETLDLVVSIDTGVAHLAGALGKPVWVMLPLRADWRWLRERADTPWYPNMRLFRQPRFGDWPSVIASVRAALQE
jgi:tetratricopeptide (TPR) repeat protein